MLKTKRDINQKNLKIANSILSYLNNFHSLHTTSSGWKFQFNKLVVKGLRVLAEYDWAINPLNPEFTIELLIHYMLRISVAVLA